MDDFTIIGIVPVGVLATAITAGVMKITAGWFDKERFAPLVSLASGLAGSLIWHFTMPDTSIQAAIGRGVIVGLVGSGLWDHFKAGKAIIKNGK
jgi:hypothetical protein